MASQPMAAPQPPPPLNIPSSNSTVKVSIIDSTTLLSLPIGVMCKPAIVGGFETCVCPAYSFLIEHPSGRRLIFDLGVRKDWENQAPSVVNRLKDVGWGINVEKDVFDILEENGGTPERIEAIIWSHYHWDHTGNPARFPGSTALIVGPGVKGRFQTAWPTTEDSPLKEEMWAGREFKEVEFNSDLKIGRFKAVDWFGDGSFYILDTPGHLLGHICGLARTTRGTFIFMGGDAAHHAGEFRPTEFVPLPQNVRLDGLKSNVAFPSPCPGELLVERLHPRKSATKPFFEAADGFNEDGPTADWTIEGLTEFDAHEDVFMVVAHDASLLDVVGFYPEDANAWKERLWARKGRWRFLADFTRGLKTEEGKL